MAYLPGPGLFVMKGGRAAALQKGVGIELAKNLDQAGHDPGPSGLMAGADAGTNVAVKILVEPLVSGQTEAGTAETGGWRGFGQ
jgi:hypothetical protein